MNQKIIIVLLVSLLFQSFGFSQNVAYQYDPNGNLISDANKNVVSIDYNVLNLPQEILFSDGRKIINTYAADGKKLSQQTILSDGSIASEKDYLDNIIYASQQLEYINTSEGYAEPENTQDFTYSYQHKDQVGNIRASFADSDRDGIADPVKEEKNYYPFGLQWQQPNSVIRGRKHNYGYGGKEEIKAFGLDWNDHGARLYDPAIVKWNGIDQLTEKYYSWSPYNYVMNNPIIFNDPDGKELRIYYMDNGVEKFYSYKGGQPKDIPNNEFVQNVLKAHQYNLGNGGGDNLQHIAQSDQIVNVREAPGGEINKNNYLESTYESKNSVHAGIDYDIYWNLLPEDKYSTIYWDSYAGRFIEESPLFAARIPVEGGILSPASLLELLAGFAVITIENNRGSIEKIQSNQGKTAIRNGEIPEKTVRQKGVLSGKTVRTSGPTSVMPPSYEILEQIMQDMRGRSDYNTDIHKIR